MTFTFTEVEETLHREPLTTPMQLAALRLSLQVERALRSTGYLSLCRVDVRAHSGVITLRGRTPSYYLKQLAQATALGVTGVCEVRNELDVVSRRSAAPR